MLTCSGCTFRNTSSCVLKAPLAISIWPLFIRASSNCTLISSKIFSFGNTELKSGLEAEVVSSSSSDSLSANPLLTEKIGFTSHGCITYFVAPIAISKVQKSLKVTDAKEKHQTDHFGKRFWVFQYNLDKVTNIANHFFGNADLINYWPLFGNYPADTATF